MFSQFKGYTDKALICNTYSHFKKVLFIIFSLKNSILDIHSDPIFHNPQNASARGLISTLENLYISVQISKMSDLVFFCGLKLHKLSNPFLHSPDSLSVHPSLCTTHSPLGFLSHRCEPQWMTG